MNLNEKPLRRRCLELTAYIETSRKPPDCYSRLVGDFDGQGMSMGALQFNFGTRMLQPLLLRMIQEYPAEFVAALGEPEATELSLALKKDREGQMAWVRSIQKPSSNPRGAPVVDAVWVAALQRLGATPQFQSLQNNGAAGYYASGLKMCRDYGLVTERAVALMFDIAVQNGSISRAVREQIRDDIAKIVGCDEVGKMRIVANRRAEDANPRFVEDVRARKLAIANGRGIVHKTMIVLEDWGIYLKPAADLA